MRDIMDNGDAMRARLEVAIVRRNARFRAWREQGVPVSGGWQGAKAWQGEKDWIVVRLSLTCGVWNCFSTVPSRIADSPEGMVLAEHNAIEEHTKRCLGLQRLLGPDPPEVKAVAELLLLECIE